jgi:4-oxalocrotonate tautomerase|tara:strand:- start:1928 stop:2125 length:198 start_codon:yes stop_codon:yes gene_type:complete
MPVVTIESWPMDQEKKKKVIEGITKVFTDMEIPTQAVTVMIHENELENWGSAGEQHSVKFKDMVK